MRKNKDENIDIQRFTAKERLNCIYDPDSAGKSWRGF